MQGLQFLLKESFKSIIWGQCIKKLAKIIIIIIIRQPLCPMVGRRPQHAVSKLPCLVLSSAISCSSICLGPLSTAWLDSLVVFSCDMVSKWWHHEVHRSSLRRLICPAQDHFIFLTVLIISMTFVFSLTQMLVFLSVYVMLSILLSILVCAAASLFCACLVSVQVSAPYVIAAKMLMFNYSAGMAEFNNKARTTLQGVQLETAPVRSPASTPQQVSTPSSHPSFCSF